VKIKDLIHEWFDKWEQGDFLNIPVSDDFTHTSPFGEITGKDAYLKLVEKNQDKFLGYHFSYMMKSMESIMHVCDTRRFSLSLNWMSVNGII
jgi:hypothetical protein